MPRKHYDLLSPETLEWFKAGTRVLSLTRTWLITEVDPVADTFKASFEDYWGVEEHTFWVYELFWFTPIRDRFHRESVAE